MLSPAVVRGSIVSLAVLGTAPVLMAASARETVYFKTPNNTISRAESARFFSCGAANGYYNPFP